MRAAAVALLLSAAAAALILGIHAANPRTLCSTHGLLHAAIVQRCERGGLPPENPFFAGRPVCYYWFFQYIGAVMVRLTGADPLHALEWLIAGGCVVLGIAGVALGMRLYGSTLTGGFMVLLTLVGGNPLGPLVWMAQGAAYGPAVFRQDPAATFGSYIYRSTVGARLYGPNLPYFLNITSRPVGLALCLGIVACAYLGVRTGRTRHALLLCLCTTLAAAMNPLIGLAAGGALIGGLMLEWLAGRLQALTRLGDPERVQPRFAWKPVLALAVGVLLALPTYKQLFSLSQGGTRFVLLEARGLKLAEAVCVSGGPLVLMALAGLRRTTGDDRRFLKCVLYAAAGLLAGAMAIELPVENSCNFFHIAMVFLAAPAAGFLLPLRQGPAGPPRAWRTAWVVGLFVPATVLAAHAYTGRAPIDLAFDGTRLLRMPLNSDLSRLYQWIAMQTPADAVIVTDPRESVAVQGNVPELPAMTGRVLLVGCEGYMTDPYPDVSRRRDIAKRLVGGYWLKPENRVYLGAMERPIYVVTYEARAPLLMRRLTAAMGDPVYQHGSVAVFSWRGR
ncbi:MAG: hypothetical protein HY763_14070 [Planctomycetes bacterium]|nr:hypothetical protein [Planctomycetota bacterium]